MKRYSSFLVVILLVTLVAGSFTPALAAGQTRYFAETGHNLSGKFLEYWNNHGGLATFGYPITEAQPEQDEETGKYFQTQWFERNRFEWHPENAGTNYEILMGLLGNQLKGEAKISDPNFTRAEVIVDPTYPASRQRYFSETGHNLRLRFLDYWQGNGGLEHFGYPISEEYREVEPVTGKVYLTQWFERARFEYHPENQPPYDVLLGLLGSQIVQPSHKIELNWVLNFREPLLTPGPVVVDSFGSLYVADTVLNRLVKFNPKGQLITAWGTIGKEPGEFGSVDALVTDKEGNILALDATNRTIQKFDPAGYFLASIALGEKFLARGLAIDSGGKLYTANLNKMAISKFDTGGTLLAEIGIEGNGDGEFLSPCSLAVDEKDNLYVADAALGRVQKFDKTGRFLLKFGSLGSEKGQFKDNWNKRCQIYLAAAPAGKLVVGDAGNHRVQVFDSEGRFLNLWGREGAYEKVNSPLDFYTQAGVAVDKTGGIYVSDTQYGLVRRFSLDGNLSGSFKLGEKPGFGITNLLAVEKDGTFYTASSSEIRKYDSAGRFLFSWGIVNEKKVETNYQLPEAMAVDNRGYFYLANLASGKIQKYTTGGALVTSFGRSGEGPGELGTNSLYSLRGLAVDAEGNIFVSDGGNGRILKFDQQGKFLLSLGDSTDKYGKFRSLGPVVVDAAGYVYAATGGIITKLEQTGKIIYSVKLPPFGKDKLYDSAAMAVDDKGYLYVVERNSKNLFKYDPTGNLVYQYGSTGWAAGQLGIDDYRFMSGIGVDGGGNIYVMDLGTNRLEKLRQR